MMNFNDVKAQKYQINCITNTRNNINKDSF